MPRSSSRLLLPPKRQRAHLKREEPDHVHRTQAAWCGRDRARADRPRPFSNTGRTLYYRGKSFQSLKGAGASGNYADVETGDLYWISGPKKDGTDRHCLAQQGEPVEIDDDVRVEYWTQIRGLPERKHETIANR